MDPSLRNAIRKIISIAPADQLISTRNVTGVMGFNRHPTSLKMFIRKDIPPEWPLSDGPYKAGTLFVTDIPFSEESKIGATGNTAIIYYPATEEGAGAPFADGGPFPLIVFGHALRTTFEQVCDGGAPTDITQDFLQLSGILLHLARWEFISISPDLSWDDSIQTRWHLLRDAITYMLTENVSDGSFFNGNVMMINIGAMGHSTGGGAAIFLAIRGSFPVSALGLIAPATFIPDQFGEISNFSGSTLVISGTNDTGTLGAHTEPIMIFDTARGSKHFVQINGANHFGYTDSVCIKPPSDGVALISQSNQQRFAKAYLTAFFRRYIEADTAMVDYLT